MTKKNCCICGKISEFYDRKLMCNSCYKKQWRLKNLERLRKKERELKRKLRKNKSFREKEKFGCMKSYYKYRKERLRKQKEYRLRNLEERRKYDLERHYKFRDRFLKRMRIYQKENKEFFKKYQKKYYEENKEEIKKKVILYYEQVKNTEEYKKYKRDYAKEYMKRPKRRIYNRIAQSRRRAKKKEGSLSVSEWIEILNKYGNTCLCCGKTVCDFSLTIDHILPYNLDGKHIKKNVQPLCLSCNSSKNNKFIDYRPF